MDRTFRYDFSIAEAAANARALNRALYGNARFAYAAVLAVSFVVVLGIALTGAYLGWWGDFYNAALIVGVGLALLLSRFITSALRRRMAKRARAGHEIEGRRVDYTFGDDGYRISTETFEGFQKWAGVDRIIDGKGSVMFVLGLNAHFLPDRLFETPEARREFLVWAAGKLTPEARARSGDLG